MNYTNISNALQHFTRHGYEYFPDAPWYVSHEAYFATKPEAAKDVRLASQTALYLGDANREFLVASGEQSFIQMMLDGQPLKQAICVTPCFRIEQRFDKLHEACFMKAELINAHDVDEGHLVHMMGHAQNFFENFCDVRIIKTLACDFGTPAFDIVEKRSRVELGSYGIRRKIIDGREFSWIYGTACAEPRLSTVLGRLKGVL